MPDDSKKNTQNNKNEAKEQRKPRNSRNQAGKGDRKADKVAESKSSAPKVPQKPPVYNDPGPEFYKNLKRETEEIVKITEEENSKYKKKEIQSNWSKYEMPIENYDDIEEQDAGADYEKLIQAPLSIGGHFQFKHEKSWDINSGPSEYDKYFDINMNNLALAISTIPFHERSEIDISLFSESEISSMNHRATKFKQKYYNDKTFATPETETQARILNTLCEGLSENVIKNSENTINIDVDVNNCKSDIRDNIEDNILYPVKDEIDLNFIKSEVVPSLDQSHKKEENVIKIQPDTILEDKDAIKNDTRNVPKSETIKNIVTKVESKEITQTEVTANEITERVDNVKLVTKIEEKSASKTKDTPLEKNPMIESPEDLEKWLDDFLGD